MRRRRRRRRLRHGRTRIGRPKNKTKRRPAWRNYDGGGGTALQTAANRVAVVDVVIVVVVVVVFGFRGADRNRTAKFAKREFIYLFIFPARGPRGRNDRTPTEPIYKHTPAHTRAKSRKKTLLRARKISGNRRWWSGVCGLPRARYSERNFK